MVNLCHLIQIQTAQDLDKHDVSRSFPAMEVEASTNEARGQGTGESKSQLSKMIPPPGSVNKNDDSSPLPAPRATTPIVLHREVRPKRRTGGQSLKGLVVILLPVIDVVYSVIGGFAFIALEKPNEEIVQNKVSTVRKLYGKHLFDAILEMNVFSEENLTVTTDRVLKHFQNDIYDFVTKEGWGGERMNSGDPKWNLGSSLLYSVSVITTIGYGTVTPKTVAGQAVTMLYALIGIPLTFVCLSNIGRYLAASFRTLYGRAYCVTCRRKWRLALGRSNPNKIELHENIRYRQQNHLREETEESACEETHAVEIPFWACLLLMVWYIVFGAILFTIWETDWDIFTGAYFCFITLSTIGFGDIVPGMTHEDWGDQVKQVFCTLYLLIGLTTIAMCFELMQERGQNIAKRCATFLGLLNEEKEEGV